MTPLMVHLTLPWFGNHDGELYYSSMKLTQDGGLDRRKAFRIMRKWYKEAIGINVHKSVIERVWKCRQVIPVMEESDVNDYLTKLAARSYEEIKNDGDTSVQEEATGETE
jgi:hypothetical protein